MNSKKWRYAVNSWVLVAAVLAAVVLFNVLVSVFVSKFPVKLDLTSKQIYEVSDKTYEYLKTYDTPTKIYILASEADEDDNVRTILDKYSAACSSIKIENIDPKTNPTFGQKYISESQSISKHDVIVDGGDRFKVYHANELYNINSQTNNATSIKVEQKITAALKYVSSNEDFNAYFVKGHNESELSGARAKLENENYTVSEINLLSEDIPENAKMLIISAPTVDFTTAELAKLDKFFDNAGKAQFIFDSESAELPNLFEYIKGWGIEVTNDYAIEANRNNIALIGQTPLIISELCEDEITADLIKNQRITAYIPYAKIIKPLFDANSGTEVRGILKTSDEAYSKSALSETFEKTSDDVFNSYIVAAVSTKQGSSPDKDAMIFVSGTSMLLNTDINVSSQYNFANYDLYMNILNFLQGSKDDYTIESKSLITDIITVPSADAVIILIAAVILLPLAILITGIVVWIRRRHL